MTFAPRTCVRLAHDSERKVQALPAVLDYSGEHNIPITTNPYGFFLVISMLLALTGLLAYARYRPTENPLYPFGQ